MHPIILAVLVPSAAAASLSAPSPPKCGPKVARPITPTKTAAYENAVAKGHAVPCVLLARTFDAGNVGSVARGMLNFGLWDLRLVSPEADVRSDEAILRASGAASLLRSASVHDGMSDATHDLSLVLATTARPRESRIPVHGPREAVALARAAVSRGERVGLLFGSEKNGLSNEELEHATAIVTIPTFPGFSSLNLAQAVLLLCYEWASGAGGDDADASADSGSDTSGSSSASGVAPSNGDGDGDGVHLQLGGARTQLDVAKAAWAAELHAADGSSARAPLGQLDSLFDWWEGTLWASGFFGGGRGVHSERGAEEGRKQEEARASAAFAKLRRLLMRAEPTKGEASLLRGALTSMAPTTPAEPE